MEHHQLVINQLSFELTFFTSVFFTVTGPVPLWGLGTQPLALPQAWIALATVVNLVTLVAVDAYRAFFACWADLPHGIFIGDP